MPPGLPAFRPGSARGAGSGCDVSGFHKGVSVRSDAIREGIFSLIVLAEDPLVGLRAGGAGRGPRGPRPQDGAAPLPGHEPRRGSSSWPSKRLRLLGENLVASSASSSSSSPACFPFVCGYRHKLEPL